MPLTQTESNALLQAIRQTAAEEILPRFRNLGDGDVAAKAHAADLVTIADRRAEEMMTRRFQAILPGDAVIGEEAISEGVASLDALAQGRCVVIDPIDGTWNYANGLANYGVLVAVVEDGVTVWGCCYDPTFDDWIMAARGEGAWFHRNGAMRRMKTVDADRPLSDLRGNLGEYMMNEPMRGRVASIVPKLARHNSHGASVVEYRQMCLGSSDFCLNAHLNVWDHAAGALCLSEAGGCSRLLDGRDYLPGMTRVGVGVDAFLLNAVSEAAWDAVAESVGDALAQR